MFFGEIYEELIESGANPQILDAIFSMMKIYTAVFGIIGLALYILRAAGVFKMARASGIKSPWLAFIPVVNSYTFGRIAEKYTKKDGRKTGGFAAALVSLNIAELVTGGLLAYFSLEAVSEILENASGAYEMSAEMTIDMFSSLVPVILLYIIVMAVTVAYLAVFYVAQWRIFAIFDYRNATLFTVLSVFFSFLSPIFLFVVRNRQPVFDPWENFRFMNQKL